MKAIGYMSVSTGEQGKSGLGLKAQQADIELFCQQNGIELVRFVSEVATAKGNYRRRKLLNEVLIQCKKDKCAIMLSKLDRLSPDVESIANSTNDPTIRFMVVQLGIDADNFQIHLFASLAQKERDWISQRTKAGLNAKKARIIAGTDTNKSSGNKVNVRVASAKEAQVVKDNAAAFTETVSDLILNYKSRGFTLAAIAMELNKLGVDTASGKSDKQWHPSTVSNQIKRMKC
ncbi:MAG: recombinase family protein [Bacteroidales bacterium]